MLHKLIVRFTTVGDTWPLSANTCDPFSFSGWAVLLLPTLRPASVLSWICWSQPKTTVPSAPCTWVRPVTTSGQCLGGRGCEAPACSPEGRGLLSPFLPSPVDWDVAAAQATIQAERRGHIPSSWDHRRKEPLSVWRLMRQVSTKEEPTGDSWALTAAKCEDFFSWKARFYLELIC